MCYAVAVPGEAVRDLQLYAGSVPGPQLAETLVILIAGNDGVAPTLLAS